jgi:hypothetical protein
MYGAERIGLDWIGADWIGLDWIPAVLLFILKRPPLFLVTIQTGALNLSGASF